MRDGGAQVQCQTDGADCGDAEAVRSHDGPGCFDPHGPGKLSRNYIFTFSDG